MQFLPVHHLNRSCATLIEQKPRLLVSEEARKASMQSSDVGNFLSSPVVDRGGMNMELVAFRHSLSAQLPGLLDRTINGYRRFSTVDSPDDVKSFAAHHAGCRAALAHIHLLVSLARWIESADGSQREGARDDLDRLLAEAENALKGRSL